MLYMYVIIFLDIVDYIMNNFSFNLEKKRKKEIRLIEVMLFVNQIEIKKKRTILVLNHMHEDLRIVPI